MLVRRACLEYVQYFLLLLLALVITPVYAVDNRYSLFTDLRNFHFPEPARQKDWDAKSISKVSPSLLELGDVASKGFPFSTDLEAAAKSLGIPLEDKKVAISLSSSNRIELSQLSKEIQASGGEITFVFDDTIYALLPVSAIPQLESMTSLTYASPQNIYYPTAVSRSPSEGGKIIDAERLHTAGITGKKVKIGILDFGFQNFQKMISAGVLPQPKEAKSFTQKRNLENGNVHGTACAEIIHTIAPDAELYFAAVDGREDTILQGAQWLIAQGVDIISFSVGGHGGPHNGTDSLDRFIDQAVTKSGNRLLWVNSAGNSGTDHWSGITADANKDGFIDIPLPDNPNNRLLIIEPGPGPIAVLINWDDWGADPKKPTATIDIDAELYRVDGDNKYTKVKTSSKPQRGRGAPLELVDDDKPDKNKLYFVLLRARKVDRQVTLHAYMLGAGSMTPVLAQGSIGSPATARLALAVGAVDVTNQTLEDFSSQGPTDDGRLKPEISAPDNTLSMSYQSVNEDRFPGTSAACPHVSGYAALLKQMQPDISRDDLIKRIIEYAIPMGEGRPNNQYGYGHISASQINVAGAGNTPPAAGSGNSSAARGNNRVFQPILDIMKQNGQ